MISLCVDAGTSLIKAVAFDESGREVASAQRDAAVLRPAPDRAEQDMDAVWAATAACVQQAAAVPDEVGLLAVTAQGDGCWLVDAAGRPAGPAILWNDARAAAIVDRWDREGRLEAAFRRSGCLGFPGLAHAILAWLAEHDPSAIPKHGTLLSCGGWLHARLTGRRVLDPSEAGNPFFSLERAGYDDALLELFGLEWARPLLPPVADGADRVAPLSGQAAAELGLPAGLPVVLAPYDVVATALGVGAAAPGQACSILGTTLCTEAVTTRPDTTGEPAGMTLASGVPGRHLRAFATLAGTGVIDWACGLLGLERPAQLTELAARADGERPGPLLLPYLSPAGERAPFRDGRARGTFVGLELGHGREAVARAVLEGLALVVGDCLAATAAAPAELRVCGGGAASDFWCQLIADVCGLPVVRAAGQAGARGALVSAWVATGRAPDADAAVAALVRPDRTFAPRAHHAAALERFGALREAARAHLWGVT